jgi:hypothetical protein
MSRRSTLRRRRERQRRRHEQKMALQLPPKVSTAALIELIHAQQHVISEVLAEMELKQQQ